MLSVVQRRREVACQWEGPEDERREVGCQSESAERRDAAVQVDLLTQQLCWGHTGVCGVAWRCVSVRADEPGGGALLQHCSAHTPDPGQHIHHSPPLYLLCPPLRHTLFGPPADLLQTTSLPSMPLCGVSPTAGSCEASPPPTPADVPAPPSGLIAPLSPRLAEEEEEEEEEEEGSLKHEDNESFRGNGRSTITAQKKKRRTSQRGEPAKHIAGRVQPGSTARRQRKTDDDEKSQPDQRHDAIQSEARSSITETPSEANSRTRGEARQRCRKGGIKTGRPAAQIQRARAEAGRHKTVAEEEEEEEEEGVKPVKTEQEGRPRRKAVGPPIRYLIEFEERSHGPSAANHSRARGAKVKRKQGRLSKEHREEEEPTERAGSSGVESSEDGGVGGGWQLCQVCGLTFTCQSSLQLHLPIHRAGRRLGRASTLRLHHHHGDGPAPGDTRAADDKRDEEVRLPAPTKDPDWSKRRKRVRRNPWWWVDYRTTKRRRRDVERWRRLQERDGGKGRKRKRCSEEEEEVKRVCLKEEGGGEEEEKEEGGGEGGGEKEEVKRVCLKEEGGGEEEEKEEGGGEGGGEKEEGGGGEEEEKEEGVGEGGGEDKEKEEGGGEGGGEKEERDRQVEVEKEVVEQPQRPRRKMVGPPIRYLLESEAQSHGPVTANQDRGWGFKQDRKPQKKSEARGGASDDTAMIDRPEDAEQTDRQAGWTVTERQTGLHRRTYLVYVDLQSGQVNIISPCCVRLQRLL